MAASVQINESLSPVTVTISESAVQIGGPSSTAHNQLPLRSAADAHPASAITNTPAGSISATTVQAAIDELDAEKQPLDADLTGLASDYAASTKTLTYNVAKAATSAGLAVQSHNGTLVVDFGPGGGAGAAFADGITCSSITATGASGITDRQAATQDGIQLLGRAGGTSSYVGTLTPTTLTASRIWTFPDAAITVAGSASALTGGRVPYVTTGGLLTDSAALAFDSTGQTLTVGNGGATSPLIIVNGAAGTIRDVRFQTAGVLRWRFGVNNAAESGSDAGSLFYVRALTDAGATIDDPISIVRASGGAITLARPVTATGVVTVPNGTAAAPGIRLTSEASGLYRIGATSIGVSVAGSLVLTVGSTASSFASGTTLTVSNTTTSTSTTTGALVVSGGVGVAGRVNAGANIDSIQSTNGIAQISAETTSTGASAYAQVRARNSAGINSYFGVVGSGAGGFGGVAASEAYMGCNNTTLHIITNDTSRISVTSAGVVSVSNTTASTSTTTGSLVTAGGFAAAKEVVTGLGLWLVDGQTAPGATTGYAKIYVDAADGDLKIIFGDGTIKTIVTDT